MKRGFNLKRTANATEPYDNRLNKAFTANVIIIIIIIINSGLRIVFAKYQTLGGLQKTTKLVLKCKKKRQFPTIDSTEELLSIQIY
jgi:hypothetical protein